MNPQDVQRHVQTTSQWASVDPFTLVSAAETSLRDINPNEREKLEGPIGEVIRRFGQQSRAAFGSNLGLGSSSYTNQ